MKIVFETWNKLRQVLKLGFHVLGGELLCAAVSLYAKDRAEALRQKQIKSRLEKFGLDPDSISFF